MRVLVTGGSSLIGAGVAAALVDRGDEVVVQQRGRSETLDRLEVRQELGDIRDLEAVFEWISEQSRKDLAVHEAVYYPLKGFIHVAVENTKKPTAKRILMRT